MARSKIKINDKVWVVDNGETYVNYSEMFQLMGFKDKKINKSFEYGTVATVFAIDRHPGERHELYGLVDSEGNQCLISKRGIEKIECVTVGTSTIDGINDRLTQIESKLDQLATALNKPAKSQTAVEWLINELTGYDYGDDNGSFYEICLSKSKLEEIKGAALQMEKQQNSK